MQTALLILAGIIIGGALGVVAMCLAQVAHCADCQFRADHVNWDGK